METKAEIAQLYFHISNGGIGFSVLQGEDEAYKLKSPLLQVSAHHFGQQTNHMEFSVRPEGLQALGEMLIAASKLVVFEGESQVVVKNPRNIKVGDEVWNKSEPGVACSTQVPAVTLEKEAFGEQTALS